MTMDDVALIKCLENADIDFSPSFVHGVLSAYACIGDNDNAWAVLLQPELDPKNVLQKEALQSLHSYKNTIAEQLADSDLGFYPLLGESDSLREQSLATREWVSGFWLGLKENKLPTRLQDEDAQEFIGDVQRIAAMPLLDEDDADSTQDLLEVQEYCRMGTIGVFLSVNSMNRDSGD